MRNRTIFISVTITTELIGYPAIDRFHVTSSKSNFYALHLRKLLEFSRASQVKPSSKILGRYEVFIRSYRHLNFVIKSPVRHAFGN